MRLLHTFAIRLTPSMSRQAQMLFSRGSLLMGLDSGNMVRSLTLQYVRHDKSDLEHLHVLLDRFGEERGVVLTARVRRRLKPDCQLRLFAIRPRYSINVLDKHLDVSSSVYEKSLSSCSLLLIVLDRCTPLVKPFERFGSCVWLF
jgi:hypothetical protein